MWTFLTRLVSFVFQVFYYYNLIRLMQTLFEIIDRRVDLFGSRRVEMPV